MRCHSEDDDSWTDAGYTVKREAAGFPDWIRSAVWEKGKPRTTPRFWAQLNCHLLRGGGLGAEQGPGGGEIRTSGLEMLNLKHLAAIQVEILSSWLQKSGGEFSREVWARNTNLESLGYM